MAKFERRERSGYASWGEKERRKEEETANSLKRNLSHSSIREPLDDGRARRRPPAASDAADYRECRRHPPPSFSHFFTHKMKQRQRKKKKKRNTGSSRLLEQTYRKELRASSERCDKMEGVNCANPSVRFTSDVECTSVVCYTRGCKYAFPGCRSSSLCRHAVEGFVQRQHISAKASREISAFTLDD